MPSRKKNACVQAGLGENQQAEASVDHVSMHIKRIESSEEVGQPGNKNLVVDIEYL